MKTLVMLVNQLRNSGPNRVMLDIAANIDRTVIKPVVLSLMPDDKVRPISDRFKDIDVEIHRMNFSFWELELNTGRVARKIEQYISSNFENPIVQGHGYHPTLLTARMKIPHTVTIHCISKEDFIKSKGSIVGNYMVRRFAYNLRGQKYPVAISSYMADFYSNICRNNIKLIYNGVPYSPKEVNAKEQRQILNLPLDRKIIIVTGGLNKRKNNIHTIRQLKLSRRMDFICVFLGIGPQMKMLEDEVAGDNRFRFEGYKSNVSDYLSVADLYISSSLSEGMPLAVLEAVCSGVPVLLSDIPPHIEIVKQLNCVGVENFSLNTDELAQRIPYISNAEIDRKQISDRAKEIFGSKVMGNKYTDLINSIK